MMPTTTDCIQRRHPPCPRRFSAAGWLRLALFAVLTASGAPAPAAGELKIERVFGPEIQTGPYKHPARLEELSNGDLYNDSMNDRTPLTVALSTDQDRSYPYRRNVATGPYDYAYPLAVQGRDGRIHLIYTSHERTVINHVRLSFNPAPT